MSPDLELALQLADTADSISLPRFRSGLTVETKADLTPVTEADRLVESELRRMLAEARPDDAVLGEEEGVIGASTRRWIVDPIDGTRNYSRGIPVWATLIALEEDAVVRVGVVSAPSLRGRWWADGPALARRAWHSRGLGDFWAHMLVAEGAVDGAVDAVGVSEWDLAAVQVIVEEAGGRFSDFAGDPRVDGGSGVSSNGLLHDELLSAIQGQTAPV
jgi:histidinol-phosphatase